jgi:hypothetical protein
MASSSTIDEAGLSRLLRESEFLLPPSVDEWLPEKHLARFLVEVVDGLDLHAMSSGFRGSGLTCGEQPLRTSPAR